MTTENIHVLIRFRPTNKREKREQQQSKIEDKPIIFQNNDAKRIGVIELHGRKPDAQPNRFTFDRILDVDASQESTFHHVAERVCNDVLVGYNGCIFAYGQTGSGKTFTMFGPEDNDNPKLMGIIPRSIAYIFGEIEDNEDIIEAQVKVSFVEIYKERLRDLLDPSTKKRLKIRLNNNSETEIDGLTETHVLSLLDVLSLIEIANSYRTKAETSMNHSSSRSHMLMILTLTVKLQDETTRIGKVNFCDLAGSEKVRKTNASGDRLKEAQKINLSLTILGQVISSLSEKKQHVPFRDSKLTHILMDSLGGNCKTTLIVNASKHMFNRDETIISLRFGSRCKLITNSVRVNKIYNKNELLLMVKKLKAENARLKRRGDSNSMMIPMSSTPSASPSDAAGYDTICYTENAENIENKRLLQQIQEYKDEINELDEKNNIIQSKNVNLENLLKQNKEGMKMVANDINKMKQQIVEYQQNKNKLNRILESFITDIDKLKRSNKEYKISEKKLKQTLNRIRKEREQSKLEIKSLKYENKEYRIRLDALKKDQYFESTQLNEELIKYKALSDETEEEASGLMMEINKLRDEVEKHEMTIFTQDFQVNEIKEKLTNKTQEIKDQKKELKKTRKQLIENENQIKKMKKTHKKGIVAKNQQINALKEEYENRIKIVKKENGELIQQLDEMEEMDEKEEEKRMRNTKLAKLAKMGFDANNNGVTTAEIVKRASVMIHNNNILNNNNNMNVNVNAEYLKSLESSRKNKKNKKVKKVEEKEEKESKSQKSPISPSEPKRKKRFMSFGKAFYDTNDWLIEKVNTENEIKDKQKQLDTLKKRSLPSDGIERMNILIHIATLEDDIVAVGRELININQKILKLNKKNNKKNKRKLESTNSTNIYLQQSMITKTHQNGNDNGTMIENELNELNDSNDSFEFDDDDIFPDFEANSNDDELMKELVSSLKNGLEITDRKYRFNTYKQCFIGRDAVTFMLNNNLCESRKKGVSLGKMLLSQNIIRCISNKNDDFKDDKLFYSFS